MECNGKDVYENSCCVWQCILNVKVLRGCDFCVICEVFFRKFLARNTKRNAVRKVLWHLLWINEQSNRFGNALPCQLHQRNLLVSVLIPGILGTIFCYPGGRGKGHGKGQGKDGARGKTQNCSKGFAEQLWQMLWDDLWSAWSAWRKTIRYSFVFELKIQYLIIITIRMRIDVVIISLVIEVGL